MAAPPPRRCGCCESWCAPRLMLCLVATCAGSRRASCASCWCSQTQSAHCRCEGFGVWVPSDTVWELCTPLGAIAAYCFAAACGPSYDLHPHQTPAPRPTHAHPHTLQWCLVVQEALLYAPWPPTLLELPEFAEVRDKGSCGLLFRGPRLKMVIGEGVRGRQAGLGGARHCKVASKQDCTNSVVSLFVRMHPPKRKQSYRHALVSLCGTLPNTPPGRRGGRAPQLGARPARARRLLWRQHQPGQ